MRAAKELGLPYGDGFDGTTNPAGCIYANDGRSTVFFNKVLTANGEQANWAELCFTGELLYAVISSNMDCYAL